MKKCILILACAALCSCQQRVSGTISLRSLRFEPSEKSLQVEFVVKTEKDTQALAKRLMHDARPLDLVVRVSDGVYGESHVLALGEMRDGVCLDSDGSLVWKRTLPVSTLKFRSAGDAWSKLADKTLDMEASYIEVLDFSEPSDGRIAVSAFAGPLTEILGFGITGKTSAQLEEEREESIRGALLADSLSREYKKNEIAAAQKYKGQRIFVTGTVDRLQISFEEPIVTLSGAFFEGVQCYFSASTKQQLAHIDQGTRVVISGVVASFIGVYVPVKDCRVERVF